MAFTKGERIESSKSLCCLLQSLQDQQVVVELRNESHVVGLLSHVDCRMNVEILNAKVTSPWSLDDVASYEKFFVASRHIRYVHIPPDVNVRENIEKRIKLIFAPVRKFDQSKAVPKKHKKTIENQLLKLDELKKSLGCKL